MVESQRGRHGLNRVGRMILLLGLAAYLPACSGMAEPSSLPALRTLERTPGLIPSEYLCSADDSRKPMDLALSREIEAFLRDGGILAGAPMTAGAELPVVLNQPVQAYLRSFSRNQNGVFATYLSRSGRYLPMMQQILREEGLPVDLVYLVLVESGFSPGARSPAGAVGPWQFIAGTARRYGLKVNAAVDERLDPEKSTRAAARYLKDLYQQFGCWYLAAAGYNAGENRVEGVVSRHDTRDFWTMAQNHLLPQETCNYVPQFIAAALIAKNPAKYGFAHITYQRPVAVEQVKLPAGTDLRWLAESLDLTFKDLQGLNPELKVAYIPSDRQEYTLKVPVGVGREARRLAKISRPQAKMAPSKAVLQR